MILEPNMKASNDEKILDLVKQTYQNKFIKSKIENSKEVKESTIEQLNKTDLINNSSKDAKIKSDIKQVEFAQKRRIVFDEDTNKKSGFSFKIYFMISIIFLIGILIGSIYFRISINDVTTKEKIIEKIELVEKKEEISSKELISDMAFSKLGTFFICWIIGASVIGSPIILFICFYKGFSLSFAISALLIKYGFYNGNIISLKSLYLCNIFMILGIFIMAASSLKVSNNVIKNKKDIRLELVRHTVFSIIAGIFMVISGFLEIYFI